MASSFHDMTSIVVDPSNPDYLYVTDADANTLQKIDIPSGNKLAEITFNTDFRASFNRHNNIRFSV